MLTKAEVDRYHQEFAKLTKEKEQIGRAMEARLRATGTTDYEWERLSDQFTELEGKRDAIRAYLGKHGYYAVPSPTHQFL